MNLINITEKCIVESCNTPRYKLRGYKMCGKHHAQMYRHGKIYTTMRDYRPAIIEKNIAKIPLGINAKYGYTIVDKEFAQLDKYKWSVDNVGYPSTSSITGDTIRLHSLIISCNNYMVTDHINRNKLDNRLSNLRIVTQDVNCHNRGASKISKTGIKNIYPNKRDGTYYGQVQIHGKRYTLGYYRTIHDAIKVVPGLKKEIMIGHGYDI